MTEVGCSQLHLHRHVKAEDKQQSQPCFIKVVEQESRGAPFTYANSSQMLFDGRTQNVLTADVHNTGKTLTVTHAKVWHCKL